MASARKWSDAHPCGAPRKHNAIPWKTLENHRFLHVRTDAMQCRPLSPSAEHEKSYGYWKTFENQWENMVSGHCRSKIKNNPLRTPFRAKADSKIYPLGTIGETLEIIGKSWFPGAVDPRLKTAPSDPFASEERWQNKKQAWICWFRPSDLISSHVIWGVPCPGCENVSYNMASG